MSKHSNDVTYRQLFRFFLPLGTVPLMIASTHTVINAALARFPSPEVMLAVFSVVKTLANAIKAPDLMVRQTTTSLVDSRSSFRQVSLFVWAVAAFFIAVLGGLAFTGAGGWVLHDLIGITDPAQITLAYGGLAIVCLLPVVEVFRNSLQGIAVGLKRTDILGFGTTVRLFTITLFLWWVIRTQVFSGVVAASMAWVVGIGLEGVIVLLYLVVRFGSPGEAAERMSARNHTTLTMLQIATFFAPLAVTITLTFWLQPIIQSGLARSISPTRSLAAYGVAWGLVQIVTGPVQFLHQASLVHTTGVDDQNWQTVKRFCLLFGGIGAIVLFGLAVSPAGYWVVHRVMAVPASVAEVAVVTLGAFSLFPLIRSWREAYWGILMHQRTTAMIGAAKAANLLTVVVGLILAFAVFEAGVVVLPTVIGAVAYTLGEGVESVLIWYYATRG